MDFSEDNKSLKPLKNKLFYLDLKISRKQDVLALSQDLIDLGAEIERFLSKDIKYVVTDRPNWKPDCKISENWAPDTPNSTPSPYTLNRCEFGDGDSPFNETDFKRNQPQTSRGRKLLEQSTKYHKKDGSTDVLENSRQWGIRILSFATVLKWVEKTKIGIQKTVQKKVLHQSQKSNSLHVMGMKKLISPFIKVEDKHRRYRTFCKEFSVWPDIVQTSHESNKVQEKVPNIYTNKHQQHLTAEGFAAKAHDLCKKRSLKQEAETKRKNYCEICCAPYSSLQQHLVTKCHRSFLSDKTNYSHLNEVISTLPPVEKFIAEHHVSTYPEMKKIDANTVPNVPSEACRVKARRRVATNLVSKFEQCSIIFSKTVDEKENFNYTLEEERIEGSCNTPLCTGFPFLEDDDAVEKIIEIPYIFPAAQVTPSGIGVRGERCSSLLLEEGSDVAKGDTSIAFDSILGISHEREEVLQVPEPETLSLNAINISLSAINILSPPNSVLCNYDDSLVDNNCENTRALENCFQLGECTGVPVVEDHLMSKQDETSLDGSVQTFGCDYEMVPEISAATCSRVPVVDDAKMAEPMQDNSNDLTLQTVECDLEMIPEISAATCSRVPVVDDVKMAEPVQDKSNDLTLQTVECDLEMIPEISAEEMSSLELLENAMISCTGNNNAGEPSLHLGDQIILPVAEDCEIVPEIMVPVNEVKAVLSSDIPIRQNVDEDVRWNSENVALDLCVGEVLLECKVANVLSNVESLEGKKENFLSRDFNDCAECIRENAKIQPLNLSLRQSAIVNDEPVGNNSMQKYTCFPTPAKKRVRGSSSQSRKVRVLSDRSMLTIFKSNDNEVEFDGFKSDDQNDSSDLSYVEVSEELGSDELNFSYEINPECLSSEVDDKWDVSLAEFIARQVSDNPQSNCKVQTVEIPMDLSTGSADTGCNRPLSEIK